MTDQIIAYLEQYQTQMGTLAQEIQQDEATLVEKRAGLEQLRGAYTAMLTIAYENGLVDENGQIVMPEASEEVVEAEVETEVIEEAEVVSEA